VAAWSAAPGPTIAGRAAPAAVHDRLLAQPLNHIQASTLIFDTRFAEQVEAARGELTSVRHLVAIGADAPDWATLFAELEAGGESEDPYLDVDEDAACFLQLLKRTKVAGYSSPA
jgi:hypothetical protein